MKFLFCILLAFCYACPGYAKKYRGESFDYGQIAIIGDSIFAYPLSRRISAYINDKFYLPVRDYSVNGAVLLRENGPYVISKQYYDRVKKDLPFIDTIIMDGGGNDSFAHENDCVRYNCPEMLDKVIDELSNFFDTLKEDGVTNVIFLGYYRPKGIKERLGPFLDAVTERIKTTCDTATLNCVFVDPRAVFEYRARENLIVIDGVHPSSRGASIIANMINRELYKMYPLERQ